MKNKIETYKRKLEKTMCEYMEMSVSERSANTIKEMAKCWEELDEMQESLNGNSKEYLTDADIHTWNSKMLNGDGTIGSHWNVEKTNELARLCGVEFTHITPMDFNATVNMMYSDYHNVAVKYGVDVTNFYGDLARAFLFDKDGPAPKEKLSAYYHSIVEKA